MNIELLHRLHPLLADFTKATGIAIELQAVAGQGGDPGALGVAPGLGKVRLSHLTIQSGRSEASCWHCGGQPPTGCQLCPIGLQQLLVSVIVDRQPVAALVAGPFLRQSPTPQRFRQLLKTLRSNSARPVAIEKLRTLYFRATHTNASHLSSIAALLRVLARHIEVDFDHALRQSQSAEAACVTQAKQIVQSHYRHPLSTRDVARRVHCSPQHFCRQFRKSTGQSFLDYLARWRVAKAKELLADRRSLMKQIAETSGFGDSVTNFDRVFKKITKLSPSEYRKQIGI